MFSCHLHDVGYGIGVGTRLGMASPMPVVVPKGDDPSGARFVELPPTAFRTFAETCGDEEGVVAFANTYGLLGCANSSNPFDEVTFEGDALLLWEAEPVQVWQDHAAALGRAIALWDSLRSSPRKMRELVWQAFLHEAVVPEGLMPFSAPTGPSPTTMPQSNSDPINLMQSELFDRISRELPSLYHAPPPRSSAQTRQIKRWGWVLLGLVVTSRLRSLSVAPELQPMPVASRARERSLPTAMALGFSAHTLIGALWLQLATAISSGYAYRQCIGCGKWLTIHPDEHRTNRTTCSTNCRSKVYRDRKKAKPRRARAPQK